MKRREDEIALREMADKRQFLRRQRESQLRNRAYHARQGPFHDPVLPMWANDAIQRSQVW